MIIRGGKRGEKLRERNLLVVHNVQNLSLYSGNVTQWLSSVVCRPALSTYFYAKDNGAKRSFYVGSIDLSIVGSNLAVYFLSIVHACVCWQWWRHLFVLCFDFCCDRLMCMNMTYNLFNDELASIFTLLGHILFSAHFWLVVVCCWSKISSN